jgi:hypothetical protein
MRRRSKGRDASRKALDLWQAPPDAGEPLVCLATTFTFDATFFETECLGRFLQMDTHPSETDTVGYLVEREEKLAAARVAVLVDRRHATDKESLRWDVLPVVVPRAAQHAKLAVLCWADLVRVIISSANLTDVAYRKNLEVCGSIDVRRDVGGGASGVRACLDFVGDVIDRSVGVEGRQGPRLRAREALAAVRSRIRSWPDTVSDRQSAVPVFSTPSKPLLPQLKQLWLPGGPPRAIRVVAPFYEAAPGDRRVAEGLLELLAKRGDREASVDVRCEEQPDGRTRVYASKGMVEALSGCEVAVRRVKQEQDGETRPLHAKEVWLASETDRLLMIGSSNLTLAGLGTESSHANFEANLVYRTRSGDDAHEAIGEVWPDVDDEGLDVDGKDLVWDPANSEDGEGGDAVPLPSTFQEAVFSPKGLSLRITLAEGLPRSWSIGIPKGATLLSSATGSGPGDHTVPWSGQAPPFVLTVEWTSSRGDAHAASWPVNVDDPVFLPPPEELRNLTLEELVEVLGSTRPLSQAVVAVLKKRSARPPTGDPLIDPLKRFSSQAYLLRRLKRVAVALDGLRQRLERPVLTREAFDWRLNGPIGPSALCRALLKEAAHAGEAPFFLAELALSLSRVDIRRSAEGGLDKAEIQEMLGTCILGLRDDALRLIGASPDMAQYVRAAFAEAVR